MKDLSKPVLSIVGVLFAMLLLGYTGFQTFSLLLEVSGSPLIAAIGLIMFEVGMIYWWWVFRNEAEGLLQMALSLLVFLACLTFVIMATALKLGAVGADILGVNTPAKIITAAAVIQLTAKLFFPLFHPTTLQAIKERVQDGKILGIADEKFDKRVDGIAADYADAMVEERTARLMTRFNAKYHTNYQLGAGPRPTVIEGQVAAPDEAPQPAPRNFFNRLFRQGRKPQTPGEEAVVSEAAARYHDEPVNEAAMLAYIQRLIDAGQLSVPVSNSTHAAPPSNAAHAGQGDAGNGAPPPVYGADTRRP